MHTIFKYLSVNLFCYCAKYYYRGVILYTHHVNGNMQTSDKIQYCFKIKP